MLSTTGGRYFGSTGSQTARTSWPQASVTGRTLEYQINSEVNESLFAAGRLSTPPTGNPSFMSVSPLELVAKNFHSGTVQAFSQANSIFVHQSQTELLNGTSGSVATKKTTETCIGRWEQHVEPLHIQVPPLHSVSTGVTIKTENLSGNSGPSSFKSSSLINHSLTNSGNLYSTASPTVSTNHITDLSSNCSRTIPVAWTPSPVSSVGGNSSTDNVTSCRLLQIKREPCQVSEVTTSNNTGPNHLPAIVKLEQPSPKISTTMDTTSNSNHNSSAIPVGIAIARQRLHQENQTIVQPPPTPSPQQKDINRYGFGITTDVGAFVPVGSMLPWSPIPPLGGYQLIRDPATGQLIVFPSSNTLEPFQPALVWPSYQQPTAPTSLQPPHLQLLSQPLNQQIPPPPISSLQLLGSSDYLTTASTTLHQHTQTHSTRLVALTQDQNKRNKIHNTAAQNNLGLPTIIKFEDCQNSGQLNANMSHTNPMLGAGHHTPSIFDNTDNGGGALHTSSVPTTTDLSCSTLPAQLFYQPQVGGSLIQIAPSNMPPLSMPSVTLEPNVITYRNHELPQMQSSPRDLHKPNLATISDDMSHVAEINTLNPPPEVQDANIQTDTPVMSEDDTTQGLDDENSMTSNAEEETNNNKDDTPNPVGKYETCHNDTNNIKPFIKHSIQMITASCTNVQNDVVVQTNDECDRETKSNTISNERSIGSNTPIETAAPFVQLPINYGELVVKNENKEPYYSDMSGLELLSNSIETFEKITIKQVSPKAEIDPLIKMNIPNTEETTRQSIDEPLGGLNLLCALAEQRIQEEDVQSKHYEITNSTSNGSDDSKPKDKLNNINFEQKIEVQDKYECGSSKCCRTVEKSITDSDCKNELPSADEIMEMMRRSDKQQELAEVRRQFQEKKRELDKIAPLLETLSQEKSPILNIKDNNMSGHLLINNPVLKLTTPVPVLSPNLSISSRSESNFGVEIPKLSSDTESSRFDDTEAMSSSLFPRRKLGMHRKYDDCGSSTEATTVPKRAKNHLPFSLSSTTRSSESPKLKSPILKNVGFNTNDDTVGAFSDVSSTLRPALKESLMKPDRNDNLCKTGFPLFGQPQFGQSLDDTSHLYHKQMKHSKHKKSKKEKHRRSSEGKERKRRINAKCALTSEYLRNMNGSVRVLTARGGLFYAGTLNAVTPPDLYSLTLDGERGNKTDIITQEDVLRDSLKEVAPESVNEVPPGTRLCAYWSQQYRCLYPGTAAELGTPDSLNDKFVPVEFDDGDSGRINIKDIRLIYSNYPVVEYDPNPLASMSKRKRKSSQCTSESGPSISGFLTKHSNEDNDEIPSYKDRKRLKKLHKEKSKRSCSRMPEMYDPERRYRHTHKHCSANGEMCKHHKHKKRRKHKKHHRRELELANPKLNLLGDSNSLLQGNSSSYGMSDSNFNSSNVESKAELSGKRIKKIIEASTEEEETSTITTETSDTSYKPVKKLEKIEKQNSVDNPSKIAAFLPARQLWGWSGAAHRRIGPKNKPKKQFFKSIQRGKEVISIGDSAVFLSTGRPDRPYIGKIISLWETSANNKIVKVKWYYHPEETTGCPVLLYPGALFESPHEDENDVQTISHKCEVLPFNGYINKYGTDPNNYTSIYDNNDLFYLAGAYNPTTISLKIEKDIPKNINSC